MSGTIGSGGVCPVCYAEVKHLAAADIFQELKSLASDDELNENNVFWKVEEAVTYTTVTCSCGRELDIECDLAIDIRCIAGDLF